MSLPSLEQLLKAQVPHSRPPAMPHLVPLNIKVTMDPSVHLPSTWRSERGKMLTNRRISEYQREGRYGKMFQLPPLTTTRPCIGQLPGASKPCGSLINSRFWGMDYLPKAGVYCTKCRLYYREQMLKEKEVKKQLKEAFEKEYV